MASQAKKTFGQITPWRSALCGRYSGFKQDRLVTLDLESEEALLPESQDSTLMAAETAPAVLRKIASLTSRAPVPYDTP
ncbi:hypothetical protein WJX84_008961 [Apatococcus fuscideae]|uniref:Uncharacterized protein n=1 Tax=Apatococcus fuscideae TaxID=2026836 RepID=A0AAW1SFC2_9CHLO